MKNLSFLNVTKILIFLFSFAAMPMHIYAQAPTTPSSNLSISSIDGDRFYAQFTRGNGANRIIVAKADSPVTAVPVDGTDYLAGAFGTGNEIAPGEFVVYKGSSYYANITGLMHSTTYHFKIYEYNGSNFSTQYLTSSYLEGSQATLTNPSLQASNITFSDVLGSKMKVSWTNGDGSSRILIVRADNPVNVEPQNLITYYANPGGYGNSSYEIGTGNYVLYSGNATSVNVTNLDPNTTYHFALYEYNGNYGRVYLNSTSTSNSAPGATASQGTNAYPTINSQSMFFGDNDGNRFYYSMTNSTIGNGEKRVIIAKEGSPVTAVPVDGNEYTGSNTFGNGFELATDEFVVYSGASYPYYSTLYGLQPHSTYYFKVFEYNGSGASAYYLTTNDSNGDPVLETSHSTLTNPTIQTGSIFINSKTTSSFNVNWTNGNGSRRILVARAYDPVNAEPQDLVSYNAYYAGYGNSTYELGNGNYVVYDGTGISVNVTNLLPGTNYHFALFEYNGSSGKLYLRPGYTFEAETFGDTPTTQVSNATFESVGASSMLLKFSRGNGSARLVIAREGAAVNVTPIDGTTYSADGMFGQGQNLGSGNFVVYNGTAEQFQLSNLNPSTQYHFAYFEYSINENNELYVTPGLNASKSTPSAPTGIASGFNYTRECVGNVVLNWTSGNGKGRLVVVSEAPLNAIPQNTNDYSANFDYGLGDAIGNGFVVYNGSGNTAPINLLQPASDYYVNIFEYNGIKEDPIFNIAPLEGVIGNVTLPSVVCNNIQVLLDANGSATIVPEDIATIPGGDCGTLTATLDISTFDCTNLGSNTVTLTITDSNNNSSTCVSTVTVLDQTAPTVITKNISIQLDLNGTASISEDAVNDGSSDACGPLTFDTNITSFNSSNIGDNTVTLTVTDGSGNSGSATAIVTVMNIGAPANDDLCDAITIALGAISAGDAFSNVGATAQSNEPTGSCWTGISNSQTVWFRFQAPATGNVTVTTAINGGTLADTHITIYEAPSNCSDLTTLGIEVGCDEDGGVGNNNYRSVATMSGLTPGNFYYIQVDGNGNDTGTFALEVIDGGCLMPTGLSVDSITDSSATISWTAGGNETNWIVRYSNIPNFDPETEGLTKLVSGLPTTEINGLNPNTTYQFYVKGDCGNGDQSNFVGPIQFNSSCLGSPVLSFLGIGEFENSFVTPTQGAPQTTYEFAVIYTNEAGIIPPYGFPRVLLDYEGNGVFTNANDRAVILTATDPLDLDTTDGKEYRGSISQLPSGTNWQARVQVQSGGCTTEFGPFNEPQVLIGPDLEIFANDIVFDNMNPELSSPLEITATIHNKSDLPAENFVVHLVNQFDTAAIYPDITVDHLGPHQSTSVVWNITTPAVPSWNPMEVFVDHTNVIIETNELNNRALRPFTNGDYNVPGAINVIASASPSTIFLPAGGPQTVLVSGYAYYTDTAVVLQDSTVAGATVSFINPITGNLDQTHTNARGYFSFRTYHGSQPGVYTAPVEVTDFTITGETPVTWELIQGPPCVLPDLSVRFSPLYESILVGESVTGNIIVSNNGCGAVLEPTLLDVDQTGGLPLINDLIVPPLQSGESFSHQFTVNFNAVGTYYITARADANDIVVESSENNNLGSMTIKVNPPLPDIIPWNPGTMGHQYLCDASPTQSFPMKNIGFVPTGSFDSKIEVYYGGSLVETFTDLNVQNIDPGQYASVSIPFVYTQLGTYSFVLTCDVTSLDFPLGDVVEISESNNVGTYYIDIRQCRPDLYVTGCNGVVVDPVDPQFPGTVTYTAIISNAGNATAVGPVEFQFTLSNGEVYPLVYEQDILPGQHVTVSTSAPTVSSGGTLLTATVDPNSLIDDTNRSNNATSDYLCWEFEPVPLCGYNFWNTIYHENESTQLGVGLNVSHLYKASEVKVRFEVSGPGIMGWILLGDAVVQNSTRCHGCPYYAGLPTPFVFNESGVYSFRMTSDPDNEYQECNETNNVLIKEVTVQNRPDMRVLSQYINPTLLNPEPGEYVFFDISYENLGFSNINDRMDLTIMVDNDILDVVHNVPGLIKNTTNTIAVPVPYSSNIVGLHVVRAIIDSNFDVNDGNRLNNEATRSFIVGSAANLFFQQFVASNETPEVGQLINIDALIKNNGDVDVEADVLFSYISAAGDTIAIGTRPINISHGASQALSIPWTVLQNPTTIVGEIINTSELEFDYNDNFAAVQLNRFNINLISTPSCLDEMGTLTAIADNGTAPYSYYWSNGSTSQILTGPPGTYGVTVIDAAGQQAIGTGIIVEDSECIVPTCGLSAISFNIPPSCNPETGAYNTTVVVSYENQPAQGSISVNGTLYPITSSPQSFEVDFYSGAVVYNIFFTDNTDCNLTILTGVTLETCEQDCEGVFGGTALPGSVCMDPEGNSGVFDENCNCIPDTIPTCIAPELSLVAQDAAGEPIVGCIEEGGQYYVLASLSGGSGNSSYTLTANEEVPVILFGEDSVTFGPFTVGTDVSINVVGNEDDSCMTSGSISSPAICSSECTSPELSLTAQDVAGIPIVGCIEADGSYYVLATLSGGSGNLTYSVIANDVAVEVEADGSYTFGPYLAGTDVNVSAYGNDNDSCYALAFIYSPEICTSECTSPELSLTAQDATGGPIDGCIEADGSYYVLATLSGGSGNFTYSVIANDEAVEVEAGGSHTFGPYPAGTDVIVSAYGIENDSCFVEASIDSPEICISECTSPELTLAAQDAAGGPIEGCIEADGSYYVLATLSGGSGNLTYSVIANDEAVEVDAEGSYTFGPYLAGTDVTVSAYGIDNDSCFAEAFIASPEICSGSCDGSDAFVTTWKTTGSIESITIPTFSGDTYNYSVDWGDGNSNTNVSGDISHIYSNPGTYTVSICGTFPRIYFNNTSNDRLKLISIEQWGTNVWTSMNGAFAGTQNMVSNATDMPNLSMVADMYGMFAYARTFNGDLNFGNWDVSNVTNMYGMFAGASVFNHDISGWNVGSVTNMENMFNGATIYNQPLDNWNVSSVTNMKNMFRTALHFNQDIGNWNVSNVTTMEYMFAFAIRLDQNFGDWNVINLTKAINMFKGVKLSTANYDNLLNGWSLLPLKQNVKFSGGNSNYCTGESAKQLIIANNGWIITDGGKNCGGAMKDGNLVINENYAMTSITLYPNPVNNELVLSNPNNIELENISIIDLTGRLVQKFDIRGINLEVTLDVSKLSSATYMVLIKGENGQISKLMIKE